MSHYHFDQISSSDNYSVASPAPILPDKEYELKRKKYPNIFIPDRGLAHSLSFQDEHSERVASVRHDVEEYNDYLAQLEAMPGFLAFFKQHSFCLSKEDITKQWSEDIATTAFSKRSYCFSTELIILDNFLFDCSIPVIYQVQIGTEQIDLPIGKPAEAYPKKINGKNAIWNWVDNGHDFCFYLWELLGGRYSQNEDSDDEDNAVRYYFDAYDQFRHEPIEPQLQNIFKKLESLGYIETHTIKPKQEDPRWNCFGKTDGTIDLALIDTSFMRNSLLKEQIELLLWQPTESINDDQYFLTDSKDKQFISNHRGAFGGHSKLKIYGKLDCPSAARYIAKGKYIQHRVFFENEETAIMAGYRPCSKCMSDAYKRWKTQMKAKTHHDSPKENKTV